MAQAAAFAVAAVAMELGGGGGAGVGRCAATVAATASEIAIYVAASLAGLVTQAAIAKRRRAMPLPQ